MAKKNYDYFEQFKTQMLLCEKAAGQLAAMLADYTDIQCKADAIHATEHEADNCLHELMDELNRSFITPIDREDIVQMANALDDITDAIEDVANLFDMLSIAAVKPEALTMSQLIIKGCQALSEVMGEFSHFKSSKKLSELIITVSHVEEEGDRLHRGIIKNMFLTETDAVELMRWKEVFDTMEEVLDAIEDAADLLDGLIIKNS